MGRAAAVCYILTTTVVLSMDWSGWSSVPTIVACGCAVVVNASVQCSSTTYWFSSVLCLLDASHWYWE